LVFVELVHGDHADIVLGQRGTQASFKASGQPLTQLQHALADQRDCLRRDAAVGPRVLDARVDLVAQAGDAHHVVLVEVRRVDRAELHALEQWGPLVLGQLQHALVEVEPRQLAVEVERRIVQIGHRSSRYTLTAPGSVKTERQWLVSSGYYVTPRQSLMALAPTRSAA
jgi:hypothetical protein